MNLNWLPGKTAGRKNIKIYHFSVRILANWSSFLQVICHKLLIWQGIAQKVHGFASSTVVRRQTRSQTAKIPSNQDTFANKGNSKVEIISIFLWRCIKALTVLRILLHWVLYKDAERHLLEEGLMKSCSKFTQQDYSLLLLQVRGQIWLHI